MIMIDSMSASNLTDMRTCDGNDAPVKKSWIAIPIVGAAVAVAVVGALFLSAQDGAEPAPYSELPDGIEDATRMAVTVLEGRAVCNTG